jgi:phosphatidate cytidylyltransferase
MLKQRVITAVVMLIILLPALFYRAALPFFLIAMVLICVAAWEWARLNGYGQAHSILSGLFCLLLCTASWLMGLLEQSLALLWIAAGACWTFAGAWVLYRGVSAWASYSRPMRLLAGLLALWVAWLSVAQAKSVGVNLLLSILLLVWVADIFAYFAGRALGGTLSRSKLAPSISPGKSWEGVWGGMIGVLVLAFAWQMADKAFAATVPSVFSRIGMHGALSLVVCSLFLTAMSVLGDLFESLVKRSAGVKDSSGLLPGHGGVLDRIDALLPTLPLAMMLYSV